MAGVGVEAVVLRRLAGMTYREIGADLGVSHVRVQQLMEQAGPEKFALNLRITDSRGFSDPAQVGAALRSYLESVGIGRVAE